MHLLSQNEAQSSLLKENDELVETNIRLRQFWTEITRKLNTLKDNYDPEKVQLLKEFERYAKEILEKRSVLLRELQGIENEIKKKKDIYYEMINRNDQLEEKIFQMHEQEVKLKLRQSFVEDLEQKWKEKNH